MVEKNHSRRELLALAGAAAPAVALGRLRVFGSGLRDPAGVTLSDTVPFNDNGYQFWAVVDHPVRVR